MALHYYVIGDFMVTYISKFKNSIMEKGRKLRFISHSLRFKLTLTLTTLIIIIILFLWVLNLSFLENFYLFSKMETLDNTFREINQIVIGNNQWEEGYNTTNELLLKIEQLGEKQNIKIYIITPTITVVYPKSDGNQILEESREIFDEYIFGSKNPNKERNLLKSTNNYNIYKVLNNRFDSQYVDLFGMLENSYFVYIQSNYQSMQESVSISNKFLGYVGVIAIILGIGIMSYISRKFTTPILQLAGIAKKMSDLDFDIKYNNETKDEIGELGQSINTLSEKLETTISELKSANNELQSDIQNKIQIDEMRKDFLSNVTHELKTPIALIQGYAEGLKDNINEDDESREFYCEVIIDEAKKMNNMVKKLLTLNQLEFGKNIVNIERFDIVELIQSVLDSTALFFKQKNITLIFTHKEPIYVWADEYLVEEVVVNYISNAINHVADANIIEVKVIELENVVRVAVFNTGANIPEEELDKIWIKFYKVDKARTREYGGNGIGLSIVKAIMTSLNQNFGVVNRNKGVEFWFELDSKL